MYWRLAAVIAVAALASVAIPAEAAFPGRDGVIAFTRTDERGNQTVWTVDPRSGHQRRQSTVPRRCRAVRNSWLDDVPAFSSSGRDLFFSHSGGCGHRPAGIYRVAVGGGVPRLVVRDTRNRLAWWPTPTPRRLLFVNDLPVFPSLDPDEFSDTIHSVGLFGGRPQRLSPSGATSDEFPAIGASGRVSFSRDRHRLLVGPAQGALLRRASVRVLITRAAWNFATSDWSPSARTIVFERELAGRGFRSDIFVIGARGRGLRRVTRMGNAVSPIWSPSGRRIAFSRSPEGHPTTGPLYVVDRNGGHRRRVLGSIDETRLSWQPLPRR